ncbi:unnamed protein product [Eruca vesicaria subsp. sativa]|uniref:Uncharacterized protein n=1 Tax=Eruca vesicaria subsp. sativa TaxID=29727 RepID=A0ABC8KDL6_ERUVS|nr:unnamed protein product [Eruca vesicaria subsp. sativa]
MKRTKEYDVLRESSFNGYGKKKHRTSLFPNSEESDLMNQSGHQMSKHALYYVEGDNYYGAKATINMLEPKIQQQHKFTFSQLWLLRDLFRP